MVGGWMLVFLTAFFEESRSLTFQVMKLDMMAMIFHCSRSQDHV